MSKLALLAYAGEKEIRKQILAFDEKRILNFKFYNLKSDTQFFVVSTGNDIFISFRGTQTDNTTGIINDWKTNLKFNQVWFDKYGKGKVHEGFFNRFKSSWSHIEDFLKKNSSEHNSKNIWLTGHSLGGAIATITLAALYYEDLFKELGNYNIGGLYTYGQPKVGNSAFCNQFKGITDRIVRVENCNDPVAILPLSVSKKSQYIHVGHPKTISKKGIFRPIRSKKAYRRERMADNLLYFGKVILIGFLFSRKLPETLSSYVERHDLNKYILSFKNID